MERSLDNLRSRGVDDHLKQTVKQSGPRAVPSDAEGVIRAAQSEGTDAETAGAESATPSTPPSNGELARLGVRDAIVPPDGFHVP
jgi:hypothetical protein